MAAPLGNPASVVNAAVQLIGGYNDQGPVTGTPPTFDGSKIGLVAGAVYNEVVYTIGRLYDYDFSRTVVNLALSGNPTPRRGFAFEYLYPATCIQLRQIMPIIGADPNNPLPNTHLVGNVLVGSALTKVVWTSIASAQAEISNAPPEGLWDAAFQEAVVRELAAKLALGGVGKPDFYRDFEESGERIRGASELRDS